MRVTKLDLLAGAKTAITYVWCCSRVTELVPHITLEPGRVRLRVTEPDLLAGVMFARIS